MLELRPNCELCDRDLPPESTEARICTYECTFCSTCVEGVLHDVCPNCGGNFVPRPIRPRAAWRPGSGLEHDPPTTSRRRTARSDDEIAEFVERIRQIAPSQR